MPALPCTALSTIHSGLRSVVIRKRSKRAFAGLALNGVGIQAPQRGWSVDVLAMRAGPSRFRGNLWSPRAHAVLHAPGAFLRRSARPRLCPAGMVADTAITNGDSADRAKHRVRVTSSAATALSARKANRAAFNGVLTGPIHFRHKGEIAAKLLSWHGGKLYARNISSPSIEQQ